jgi:hypothetical protein
VLRWVSDVHTRRLFAIPRAITRLLSSSAHDRSRASLGLGAILVAAHIVACGGDDNPPPGATPIDGAVLFEDTGSDGAFLPPAFEAGPDTAAPPVDAACSPPAAVAGSSDDCYPVGPATEQCGDASATGWLYVCPAAEAGAAPSGSTGCVAYSSFGFDDASYSSSICPMLACTRATSDDGLGCDGGNAYACPADSLDDGGALASSSCSRSTAGWAAGMGMPGPIYCCP